MRPLPVQRIPGPFEKTLKFLKPAETPVYNRVLGVDPSSRKIACTLVDGGTPIATMAINLGNGDSYERIYCARKYFPSILEHYKPEFVAIEQTILIQNPETTRKLSYIVGTLIAECLVREIPMEDVPPSTWKSFMGVKPLTKNWKQKIISELGETAGRKEIERLRKSQLQDILSKRYPQFGWIDNDISDSCGIALWGYNKWHEGI